MDRVVYLAVRCTAAQRTKPDRPLDSDTGLGYAVGMATSTQQHQANSIFATCLICPQPELTASQWSQMLWTLAFLENERESE